MNIIKRLLKSKNKVIIKKNKPSRKVINIILLLSIIGLFLYGENTGADGYMFISINLLFYTIMYNLLFIASRRRINNKKSITIELILFLLMYLIGGIFIWLQKTMLCSFECFGIDVVFFEEILLKISCTLFLLNLFLTTKKKQKNIVWIITFILVGLFLFGLWSYFYFLSGILIYSLKKYFYQ